MPDWSTLTDRVGGLAQQKAGFELMCFIDNSETDTQVGVWRDERKKRLVVAFRGTEKWQDVLIDVNILLDEYSESEAGKTADKNVMPAAGDLMAAMRNTTSSWKTERVKPLPEALALQKGDTSLP
ncbi:unnamed protein product [Laminaria digitata]